MRIKRGSGIFKAIFSVATIVVIVKIIGFLKQIYIASVFGTTIETDLVSLSQGLIGEFDFFITHALITAFTAVYVKSISNVEESKNIISGILKIFIPISLACTLLFLFASPFFAKIIAPSYSDDLLYRLSSYIKIFSPIVVAQIIISIQSATLTANKKFLWQQLIGLNQSIIIIAVVFLFSEQLGTWTLIIGFGLAAIFNVIFTGIPAKKYYKTNYSSNPFKNKNIILILKMMLPLLIGYAMIYVNQITDKILSSGMEEGAVTALSYSSVLTNLVLTLVTSILSVLFVYITSHISNERHEDAARLTVNSMIMLIVIFLPISLIMCLCSQDIVRIVYFRGAFTEKGVLLTSQALLGYSICIVPYCARELFARYLYGYQDSKRPMINSCIGIAMNIILSIILSQLIGILGIAIGSSISDMICAGLNIFSAQRKTKEINFKPLLKAFPFFFGEALICLLVFFINLIFLNELNVWLRMIFVAGTGVFCSYLIAFPIIKNNIYIIKNKRKQEII